ncbi:hypothetical protein ACFLW0_00230 [Chloroflexota bacterium]
MDSKALWEALGQKGDNAGEIADAVIETPELLPVLMEGMSSPRANPKFKSAKILRMVSEKNPRMLYPHFDYFAGFLDSGNSILMWNAMDILGNLATVDSQGKFDLLFDKFYKFLDKGSLITAGHVVASSGKIARAKPYFEKRITEELLRVKEIPLPTEECRRILGGGTIEVFGEYFKQSAYRKKIVSFVESYLDCSRNSTRKKAEAFLKKYDTTSAKAG